MNNKSIRIVSQMSQAQCTKAGRHLFSRNYATEASLLRSKNYETIQHLRHLIVRTADGRWTAVIYDCDWQVALNCGFAIVGN